MPTLDHIPAPVLQFLRDLAGHNDRDWFKANRDRYDAVRQHMVDFAETVHDRLGRHDVLEPQSGKQILFRIYRDVRFSKDKSPYKTNFAGYIKRSGKLRRGGFYFHIQPGGSFVGGGFWNPNKEDLLRIRTELAADARPLREIIAGPAFQKTFGELQGDAVKTAPKGFSRDHPDIDLIRHKQFVVSRQFSDPEVQRAGFADAVVETFNAMLPFFDYMSEVLTTDANGQPLV